MISLPLFFFIFFVGIVSIVLEWSIWRWLTSLFGLLLPLIFSLTFREHSFNRLYVFTIWKLRILAGSVRWLIFNLTDFAWRLKRLANVYNHWDPFVLNDSLTSWERSKLPRITDVIPASILFLLWLLLFFHWRAFLFINWHAFFLQSNYTFDFFIVILGILFGLLLLLLLLLLLFMQLEIIVYILYFLFLNVFFFSLFLFLMRTAGTGLECTH